MTSDPDRQALLALVDEAREAGLNQKDACKAVGIAPASYYRWLDQIQKTGETTDLRHSAKHPEPKNKISSEEKAAILDVLHSAEFVDSSPHQVVAKLADQGTYLCSESSCYRILLEEGESHHRGRSRAPVKRDPPSHSATAPNQLWSWDITYLDGPVKGQYFYLYMIIDIFSRFIVGWEVWNEQTGEYAKQLISNAYLSEKIGPNNILVLHSDNGSPMKAYTMLAKLKDLGIEPSYSRPHVSNDNPYSESLFKTCKYRPNFKVEGFATLMEAREWCYGFVKWYNYEHCHSGIKFLTPHQRHHGLEKEITENRQKVYEDAKAAHPERWNGRPTRNWIAPDVVYLNRVNT